jgi:hypothetical protein
MIIEQNNEHSNVIIICINEKNDHNHVEKYYPQFHHLSCFIPPPVATLQQGFENATPRPGAVYTSREELMLNNI